MLDLAGDAEHVGLGEGVGFVAVVGVGLVVVLGGGGEDEDGGGEEQRAEGPEEHLHAQPPGYVWGPNESLACLRGNVCFDAREVPSPPYFVLKVFETGDLGPGCRR